MNVKRWLVPAMVLLLAACGTKKEEKFVRSVKLVQPVALSNVSHKSLSGVVKESEEISLGFKTGGQIEKIFVKEGEDCCSGSQRLSTGCGCLSDSV